MKTFTSVVCWKYSIIIIIRVLPRTILTSLSLLDDKFYTDMKPASTNASLFPSYEVKKVDYAQEPTHDSEDAG